MALLGNLDLGAKQRAQDGSSTAIVTGYWDIGAVQILEATAGGSSIKTISGLAYASIKTVNGLAIASVKTVNGLA